MFGDKKGTPPALLHNLKHNKVLHERVVFLAVVTHEVPAVPEERRWTVEDLGAGFWQVKLSYGFMEDADVPAALATIDYPGLLFKPMETTFFRLPPNRVVELGAQIEL
jgi:KUP system potassium uptake protein